MSEAPPGPIRHCPSCAGGLYAAVRFCPFCGAAQAMPGASRARDAEPEASARPAPPPAAAVAPPPLAPGPVARATSPVPAVAAAPVARPSAPAPLPTPPPPPPAAAPRPAPIRPSRPLGRFGLGQAVLAVAAIAALAVLALARREDAEAPTRLRAGPSWTAVALAQFEGAPLLRLTGDGPFGLRLDGERVLRVAPAEGATVRPRTLRSLEVRAGRGEVTVTLTPRGR